MVLRASVTDRPVDLPPLYRLIALRESGDAFSHACINASAGAGTLVWVRRFDLAEFAVILEPEEPLANARRAHYVGMNALADALVAHAPPERPIGFGWPDALEIDGVLVGGGRLGWPVGAAEDAVPDWLVFGAMIRTAVLRAGEPGLRPLLGSLDELGFEAIDAAELVAGFARHLMAGLNDWLDRGFAEVERRFLGRLSRADASAFPAQPLANAGQALSAASRRGLRIADNGDLLQGRGPAGAQRDLAAALAAPSWLDPATRTPWL